MLGVLLLCCEATGVKIQTMLHREALQRCARQAALERQDLSCTYLADHELEGDFYVIIVVVIIIIIISIIVVIITITDIISIIIISIIIIIIIIIFCNDCQDMTDN